MLSLADRRDGDERDYDECLDLSFVKVKLRRGSEISGGSPSDWNRMSRVVCGNCDKGSVPRAVRSVKCGAVCVDQATGVAVCKGEFYQVWFWLAPMDTKLKMTHKILFRRKHEVSVLSQMHECRAAQDFPSGSGVVTSHMQKTDCTQIHTAIVDM